MIKNKENVIVSCYKQENMAIRLTCAAADLNSSVILCINQAFIGVLLLAFFI
jgi:hypothetical protein